MSTAPVEARPEPAPTTTPVEAVQNLDAATTQTEMLSALRFVQTAIPSRPTVPVLACVLIEGHGDHLTVSAFDYELAATEKVPGRAAGRALVPARLLLDMIAGIDKGVDIALKSRSDKLEVAGGGVSYLLPTMKIDEYPALPTVGKLFTKFSPEILRNLTGVTTAAGRDDSLPVLTGVRIEGEDNHLVFAATDRYRLTVFEATAPVKKAGVLLVPAKTLTEVVRHFGKTGADVKVTWRDEKSPHRGPRHEESHVTFVAGARTLATRTLQGEFPKYRALLPAEYSAKLIVDMKDLVKATKQVALVAERTTPVRLVHTVADGLTMEAGGGDAAAARKPVGGAFEGDELTIAFNPKFLLDGLAACGGEQIAVGFTGPAKPAVIHAADRTDFRFLLMPVRLAG